MALKNTYDNYEMCCYIITTIYIEFIVVTVMLLAMGNNLMQLLVALIIDIFYVCMCVHHSLFIV